MIKRFLVFVHRWLGVAFCLFFLIWFPSGIGMMYWDFPSVSAEDRLARAPSLDPATIAVSPAQALSRLGERQPPDELRLNTFDGRPAYRIRFGRRERIVFADSGGIQQEISRDVMDRAASRWTGLGASAAVIESIDVDQWTVQGSYRTLAPLWKYSWSSGEQVYVSGRSGEVVQYTTTASRLGAYLGPIPHWLYFTPLRRNQPAWSRVVIWTSGIATVAAILGIAIGVWMYSPRRRYRLDSRSTSIPYRGQKRWHMALGLIFGAAAATYAFSGMLSMDPFPAMRPSRADRANLGQALRGGPSADVLDANPAAVVAKLTAERVKEIEFTSFGGRGLYLATVGDGRTRVVPRDGETRRELDRAELVRIVEHAIGAGTLAETRVITEYDWYYLDRLGRRPLPALLVRLNDGEASRYYIDPATARIVGAYSAKDWMSRWLYHFLHSLDVPWLYRHRPAWDIVVISLMLGGTALGVTSLVLAWRVIGRVALRT